MLEGALAGLRVLDLTQVLSGPFCTQLLADHGADVIKVEPPAGDPARGFPPFRDDDTERAFGGYFQSINRGKRSLALDLKQPAGREVFLRLLEQADVVVENFRPGVLEDWGLGWKELSALNPGLVMLRISGYGQTGPYRDRPGFGVIGEAMGGLRHLTGEPGRLPVRVGVSIGDTLAALHGAIGILLALYHRKVNGGAGQVIDVALYEAVFNCMESLLSEYSAAGVIREPAGSALPGIAPSNAYPCSDGHVLIAGNGDSIFRRLMETIGRHDLEQDTALADNEGRVARAAQLDEAIGAWTRLRRVEEVLGALQAVRVPCGRVYSARDIAEDPQYRARGMIQTVTTRDGDMLEVPGIIPQLSLSPGGIRYPAPRLGEDTEAVLASLGIEGERLSALRGARIV